MTENTEALSGMYHKLPSGKWGIRSRDRLTPGDTVEIYNRTRRRVELVHVTQAWKKGNYWYATITNNRV